MIKPNFKTVSLTAQLPTQNHESDAGVDFYLAEDVTVPCSRSFSTQGASELSENYVITDLGITWEPEFTDTILLNLLFNNGNHISEDEAYDSPYYRVYEFLDSLFKISLIVKSRSGRAFNEHLEVTNAGVIDQDYRGNFKIKLYNNGTKDIRLKQGDKVAQGLIIIQPKLVGVDLLNPDSERGNKGFGSSGNAWKERQEFLS